MSNIICKCKDTEDEGCCNCSNCECKIEVDRDCCCDHCDKECCEQTESEEWDGCGCCDKDSCHCNSACYETEFSTDEEDKPSTECEFDEKTCTLRGKWVYDGCSSIDEMIEALQKEITLLTDLKQDGWELQEKVLDDRAYLVKTHEE